MTEQEFWARARERKWHVTMEGFVRCADGKCPLAAVAGRPGPVCGPRSTADALGLTHLFAIRIARAADEVVASQDRAWLLENLGAGGTSGDLEPRPTK